MSPVPNTRSMTGVAGVTRVRRVRGRRGVAAVNGSRVVAVRARRVLAGLRILCGGCHICLRMQATGRRAARSCSVGG